MKPNTALLLNGHLVECTVQFRRANPHYNLPSVISKKGAAMAHGDQKVVTNVAK